jgi:hypothetical protein
MDLIGREFYVKFDFIDKHEFLRDINDTSINIQTLIGSKLCICTHTTWCSEYAKGWMVMEL